MRGLTTLEMRVLDYCTGQYRKYKRGFILSPATTKSELAWQLDTSERQVRLAISGLRQKGHPIGFMHPKGYGILTDRQLQAQRADLVSRLVELKKGIDGVERALERENQMEMDL